MKRERDRERAEAELSALVRLRYNNMLVNCHASLAVRSAEAFLASQLCSTQNSTVVIAYLCSPCSSRGPCQCTHSRLTVCVCFAGSCSRFVCRVSPLCLCLFTGSQALALIHEHGIAHRDLHPGNILYDAKADQVVITDFGLAGFCNGLYEFGGVGTDGARADSSHADCRDNGASYYRLFAGFRAPEVVDAVASTVACDVFSAGVLVAMLLRELVPSAFQRVDDVLGEEDLSADKIDRLQQGCAQDNALPASAKEVIIATLDSSPASRPSARHVLSFAFFDTNVPPSTPVSSRKRVHPPSPPSSSESSPEHLGE